MAQLANLHKGDRVIALINRDGRTGFDASPSQWITVEVVKVGVRSLGPGPVYANGIEDWVRKQGAGRYVVVRTVEADKAKGEPSYFHPGKAFLVGPHQITDLAGYQRKTAATRAKEAARMEANERRREAQRIVRMEDNLHRLTVLADVEGLSQESLDQLRRLVRSGWLEVNSYQDTRS